MLPDSQNQDTETFSRKFWRNCLPRLKYHNPAVPMTVNRTTNQTGPALMTVHFTSPGAAATIKPEISSTTNKQTSTGPVPESKAGPPTERTEVINMKHRQDSEILEQLLKLTKAKVVRPTAEEQREIQEMEEQNARSERDAAMMAEVNATKKREAEILEQARGEVEAMQD
jgi:large subunit ribosomal protein MRP49